jgi:hypothetical protein
LHRALPFFKEEGTPLTGVGYILVFVKSRANFASKFFLLLENLSAGKNVLITIITKKTLTKI